MSRIFLMTFLCAGLGACTPQAPRVGNTTVYLPVVRNAVLSWHAPAYADVLLGARPLYDGPPAPSKALAITRAALHTNVELSPIDALQLSAAVTQAARVRGLPPEFLAATLLQESAFDPRAISSAGAIGIAQFMPSTADAVGIDPFDPYDAIDGAAQLLSSYVQAYAQSPNPYVLALAAYNAGPGAVAAYHGVPPYPETRDYINLIFDRWAKIVGYERRTTAP
ncbi:MAG TPA: lytic transglycosylase domain-containing protein [Candidatus Baltobacteraceae bacterium]|nr:lytic transglycosylase domain-containing protein [Candidatus Baltobacteraceae bacterium]